MQSGNEEQAREIAREIAAEETGATGGTVEEIWTRPAPEAAPVPEVSPVTPEQQSSERKETKAERKAREKREREQEAQEVRRRDDVAIEVLQVERVPGFVEPSDWRQNEFAYVGAGIWRCTVTSVRRAISPGTEELCPLPQPGANQPPGGVRFVGVTAIPAGRTVGCMHVGARLIEREGGYDVAVEATGRAGSYCTELVLLLVEG